MKNEHPHREEIMEKIDLIAKEAEEKKESTIAVVLYALQGALHSNADVELANLCQQFALDQKTKIIASRN